MMLTISPAKVCYIIIKARELDAIEEDEIEEDETEEDETEEDAAR